MVMGIYEIRLDQDSRRYIGSSININQRWARHRKDLRLGIHHSVHLQRAWTKYGPTAFSFSILEECDREALMSLEQRYINEGAAFNSARVARASANGSRGPRSAETKAKISLSSLGKVGTRTGHRNTPEHNARISLTKMGHVVSEATRLKMSNTHKKLHVRDLVAP